MNDQQQLVCQFKPDARSSHAQWVSVRTYSWIPPRQPMPQTRSRMLRHNVIEAWNKMLKKCWRLCPPPVRCVTTRRNFPAKVRSDESLYWLLLISTTSVFYKEGCEEKFIAETEQWVNPQGMLDDYLAMTGERSYCFVGLWDSEESLVAARPQMIEHLNKLRDFFEELSHELGVTEPVSGLVFTRKG